MKTIKAIWSEILSIFPKNTFKFSKSSWFYVSFKQNTDCDKVLLLAIQSTFKWKNKVCKGVMPVNQP